MSNPSELREVLDALVGALEDVEWSVWNADTRRMECPWCSAPERQGHTAFCRVAKALAAARATPASHVDSTE